MSAKDAMKAFKSAAGQIIQTGRTVTKNLEHFHDAWRYPELVCAFLWFELGERLRDGFDERFECSRGGLSQQRLLLGEGLFDRVEVGAVLQAGR
jgi:hypothetical protein